MSDPTYRIDVTRDPHGQSFDAKITRLSDDMPLVVLWAPTREEAAQKAREWVCNEVNAERSGLTLYVGDDGQPVEAHSVKA